MPAVDLELARVTHTDILRDRLDLFLEIEAIECDLFLCEQRYGSHPELDDAWRRVRRLRLIVCEQLLVLVTKLRRYEDGWIH